MTKEISCPECHGPLERYPHTDISSAIKRFICANSHKVGVDARTGRIVSVTIPFKPLSACPDCGEAVKGTGYDRVVPSTKDGIEDGRGIVRIVQWRCPNGHVTLQREFIQKLFPEAEQHELQ